MVRSLTGRRILITGASRGIGRCLAQQAAAEGARLVLTARSADKLKEVEQTLAGPGREVVSVPADITLAVDRQRLLRTAEERFGGLDVLINNAGIGSFGHFENSYEAVLRGVMEVNFFAPAELIRLAIPVLRRGEQPAILNIASMCGRRGLPAWSEYSASKFALCGLTEALRGEMVRFGIDVLLVLPGLTASEMGTHLLRNEGRMKIDFATGMPPDRVAKTVLRALRRNWTETIVGREAWQILLFNRFFPRLVDALMVRKVRSLYATG